MFDLLSLGEILIDFAPWIIFISPTPAAHRPT